MANSSYLTHTLASLARNTRPIREWTRFGIYELAERDAANTNPTTSATSKKDLNRRIDTVVASHKLVDNFYNHLGFPPLPPDSPMQRHWHHKLAALRKAVDKLDNKKHARSVASRKRASNTTEL